MRGKGANVRSGALMSAAAMPAFRLPDGLRIRPRAPSLEGDLSMDQEMGRIGCSAMRASRLRRSICRVAGSNASSGASIASSMRASTA